MRAKLASAFASLLLASAVSAAPPPDRFGETCTGSESVQVGAQAPKQAPYEITLSIDLAHKTYCYAACGRDQTYPVADPSSTPIRLADTDVPSQMRRLTLDRGTSRLTDEQRVTLGAMRVVRHASATCKPAAFQQPPTP